MRPLPARLTIQRARLWLAALSLLALVGCGMLGESVPTVTPYPFLTATPRPPATPAPNGVTPSPTIATAAATPIPTLFGSPSVPTIGPRETFTPTPTSTLSGVETCSALPQSGFGKIFLSDPGLAPGLGCPTSPGEDEPPQAFEVDILWEPFERGSMLWVSQLGWEEKSVVYVIYPDTTYLRIDDTYDETRDPLGDNLTPPDGLLEPIASLGKVWRENVFVRDRLGWATAPVTAEVTHIQIFTNGEIIYVTPEGRSYVFKQGSPNTWLTYDQPF